MTYIDKVLIQLHFVEDISQNGLVCFQARPSKGAGSFDIFLAKRAESKQLFSVTSSGLSRNDETASPTTTKGEVFLPKAFAVRSMQAILIALQAITMIHT